MAQNRRVPEPPAPSILIVDDERSIRTLFRRILEEVGYSVDEARNGREALRAIEDKFFNIIVLDLAMPEMDGLEFIPAVRTYLPGVRVIVTSGFMEDTILGIARRMGADSGLAKPMAPKLLLKTVCTLLADYYAGEPAR